MNSYSILNKLNRKYYPIISAKYGSYVKLFAFRRNLATGVYLIPQKFCVLGLKDIAHGMAGKTPRSTGNIYIRKEAFTERTLVHEYIHRLSINYKRSGILRFRKVLGFCVDDELYYYSGINELMTEWITYSITKIKVNNIYQHYLYLIDELKLKIGEQAFQEIIFSYFNNDITPLNSVLDTYCVDGADKKLHDLADLIFGGKTNVEFHFFN